MAGASQLLTVPNVSEGSDPGRIGALRDAFTSSAALLDEHSDATHNRTVFTLAPQGAAAETLAAGAERAVEAIDLTSHAGDHPRIGALDVAPVVYVSGEGRGEAHAQALQAAERIAELGVPVFLYGELASTPERRERAYFRNGGLDALRSRMAADEVAPDFGPRAPHTTAGATLVTARPPLAAFNIEFTGLTLKQAREVAGALREAGGGRPGVRAIAVALGSEDRTQISTNVHDPVAIPLAEVLARAVELAEPHAGKALRAEIVGLVPRAALAGWPEDMPIAGFDRSRGLIEVQLEELARR
jgi:glutamate formiminotransferase